MKVHSTPRLSGNGAGMLNKIYWKLRIVVLALRWCRIVNLGDLVWYKGKKYTVCNGARYGSWRLGDLENTHDGWVPRKDCRKVWTLANIRHSFWAGYNFYMTSWYDIWCRDGIKPWMRGCNIWGKR